jgi:hypothetical protein
LTTSESQSLRRNRSLPSRPSRAGVANKSSSSSSSVRRVIQRLMNCRQLTLSTASLVQPYQIEDEDGDDYENERGSLNQNADSIVLLRECLESRAWSPLVFF